MTYNKIIRSVLDLDVPARHSKKNNHYHAYNPFREPIIHRQINGEEIVPLNLSKLWNTYS